MSLSSESESAGQYWTHTTLEIDFPRESSFGFSEQVRRSVWDCQASHLSEMVATLVLDLNL
jgi:hypothetical protein